MSLILKAIESLTHFSQRYQIDEKDECSIANLEAKAYYNGNLFLANDFDVFYLDCDGALKVKTYAPIDLQLIDKY